MPIFLLLFAALFAANSSVAPKFTLTVEVQHIETLNGNLEIGVFKPCTGFPGKCRPVVKQSVWAAKKTMKTQFEIEPGEYAIAIYHDLNGDGNLNTNFFGLPKEPYGFSNNYRPRLSAPKFSDCRILVGHENKQVQIRLD